MKLIKSILIVVCTPLILSPLTILAEQYGTALQYITEISADPEMKEDDLNLSKSSSLAAGCPEQSLFGQSFQLPSPNTWEAKTSDNGTTGSILAFDNFINAGSINKVSFWGINAFHSDGNWYICFESQMNFQIEFYSDNNGIPGNLMHSFNVTCPAYFTGLIYGGAFELYQYFADLPEPVEMSEGWIAIQGLDGNPECWFEWMSSVDGYDASSLQWDGFSNIYTNNDRAFCLQHQEYICGDIDGDNSISIFDIIYFIYYKYKGGPPPASLLTADLNQDGYYNILDIVVIIR